MRPSKTNFYEKHLFGVLLYNGDLWFKRENIEGVLIPEHTEKRGDMYKFKCTNIVDFGNDVDIIVVLLENRELHVQMASGLVKFTENVDAFFMDQQSKRFFIVTQGKPIIQIKYGELKTRKIIDGFEEFVITHVTPSDDKLFVSYGEYHEKLVGNTISPYFKGDVRHFVNFQSTIRFYGENGYMASTAQFSTDFEIDMYALLKWCQNVYTPDLGAYIQFTRTEIWNMTDFPPEPKRKIRHIYSKTSTQYLGCSLICGDFTFLVEYSSRADKCEIHVHKTEKMKYILPLGVYNVFTNEIAGFRDIFNSRIQKICDWDIPRIPKWGPETYAEFPDIFNRRAFVILCALRLRYRKYAPIHVRRMIVAFAY